MMREREREGIMEIWLCIYEEMILCNCVHNHTYLFPTTVVPVDGN